MYRINALGLLFITAQFAYTVGLTKGCECFPVIATYTEFCVCQTCCDVLQFPVRVFVVGGLLSFDSL